MNFSTLDLRWRIRAGGGGRTEQRYLDFVVDDLSLQDRLRSLDQATGLGCWLPAAERAYIQQLLARAPAESPSGRVPIYVCAECGDLSCGAITAFVDRIPEGILWRGFAYENDYDESMQDVDSYHDVGPFLFKELDYERLLRGRAAELPLV